MKQTFQSIRDKFDGDYGKIQSHDAGEDIDPCGTDVFRDER